MLQPGGRGLQRESVQGPDATVGVTAVAWVIHRDGFFHRRHLLAEARRHVALVLRGRHRDPGLDERIVDAALAAHCTDITEPRTARGEGPEYRLYTARWARPGPLPARRRPTAAPDHDANRRPPTDQAAPHLPLDAGEWTLPRDPLRHDRAVIASAVLSARLRTARRAGRDPYDVFAHQQAAMPEQLLLLGQEEQPTQKKADRVDIARCAPTWRGWSGSPTNCSSWRARGRRSPDSPM
ncbi:hypothetical protein [Streptomyces mirabilis]|uniref:hypothetical protein n=1 Tax=Streptomyces mirabilis TaxID=68239 RepID=UPI00364C78AB